MDITASLSTSDFNLPDKDTQNATNVSQETNAAETAQPRSTVYKQSLNSFSDNNK